MDNRLLEGGRRRRHTRVISAADIKGASNEAAMAVKIFHRLIVAVVVVVLMRFRH
jgi:hypothetical protein